MTKCRTLHELCLGIQDGYRAGKSGLDEDMLGLLVELGDRAEEIGKLLAAATEAETVMRQLQDLPDQARSIIAQGYFAAALEKVRSALAAARAQGAVDAPVAVAARPGAQRIAELARYVSDDDAGLPRREFLRLVADRIHEDVAGEPDRLSEPGPVADAALQISYSIDGGQTFLPAAGGVRVLYACGEGSLPVPGEDGRSELLFNFTAEGLITDLWVSREADLDHNLGTSSQPLDQIIASLEGVDEEPDQERGR